MAEQANAAQQPKNKELKDTGYELFILLLSLVSIFNMAVAFLAGFVMPDQDRLDVIVIIDTILTLFFLFDFCYRILTTSSKSTYFFKNWGWADLLACLPMFRVFRLFRIVRAVRLMRTFGVKNMINEVINNRAGSALYITVFSVIVLAEIAAMLVLQAEKANPDANIKSGGDAVWWVFVTITTVGYGDRFPTTPWGRTLGVVVMFCGIALLGVLTSFLASFFVSPPKKKAELAPDDPKAKLAEIRALFAAQEEANQNLKEKLDEIEKLL
jgi:voltage-gated potassium channel